MENSIEDFLSGFQENNPVYQVIQEVRNGIIPNISSVDNSDNSEPQYSVEISGREPVVVDEETKNRILEAITLKKNSETLLISDTTSRFSGALWYEAIQKEKVILAGLGGIGSYVGFLLSRLRVNLIMYDSDIVDESNMSGQLYGINDIGNLKSSCLYRFITQYSNFYNVFAIDSLYNSSSAVERVMICGFDNMKSRKLFFDKWLSGVESANESEAKDFLFIDGRLAAEEFQVFAIQGNDQRAIKEYTEKWLFKDEEAEATVCSYKQTTFMANMIASVMVNIFVNFVANKCNPLFPREVPFFTYYSDDNMFFKVES